MQHYSVSIVSSAVRCTPARYSATPLASASVMPSSANKGPRAPVRSARSKLATDRLNSGDSTVRWSVAEVGGRDEAR